VAEPNPHEPVQPDRDGVQLSRHGPHVQRRAARRAQTIVASNARSELVGAADFLYAVLRVPGTGVEPEGGPRSASHG
jgi:hypothetical protein